MRQTENSFPILEVCGFSTSVVFSERASLYAVARPSVCRLSVCNARAPYSGG